MILIKIISYNGYPAASVHNAALYSIVCFYKMSDCLILCPNDFQTGQSNGIMIHISRQKYVLFCPGCCGTRRQC